MAVFGWIMLSLLAMFGIGILVIFAIPFVVTEVKAMAYKIKKAMEDKKLDIDKKSDERRNRDELRRQKQFELANKKLDAKMVKLDKQIKILDEKQNLARELKKSTVTQKAELNKIAPVTGKIEKQEIEQVQNDFAIPSDESILPDGSIEQKED